MKTAAVLAFAGLFAGAIAAPLEKRAATTVVVVETVFQTSTVWVDHEGNPTATVGAAAAANTVIDAEISSPVVETPAEVTVVPTTSSSSEAVVEVVTSPTTTSTPPAVTPTTVIPETTSTSTSTPPVQVAAVPTTSSTTVAAPAAPTAPASSGSGSQYSGDITHYSVGLGSCGWTNSDSEAVVAISTSMMGKVGNSNNNPNCGRTIAITYNGVTTNAKVVDTCAACAHEDIDLSPTLFNTVAPNGDGRVKGVQWSYTS